MPTVTRGKTKRRTHTRGRADCSVAADAAARRTAGKRATIKVTVDGRIISVAKMNEPRAPIGTKFTRHTCEDKSTSSKKASVVDMWMEEVCSMGIRGIRKEFVNELKNYVASGPQTAWENEKNYDKNRFEDIRLLDASRVTLKNTPDNEDYIHASYVRVDDSLVFICAQGPLKATAQHFLIMVVQESCKVIVQLCASVEDGKEQSAEYMPGEGSKDYGAVRVKVLEKPKHVLSLKKVVRTKLQITYAGTSHETEHILYTGWPDHSVPDSITVCKEVRSMVHKYSCKKPVIVHCGAGIGRTGAYVGMEMALFKLQHKEMIIMGELLKDLRSQRMGAVQNDQQYLFIYRMVIEVLLGEDVLVKDQRIIDFIKEYDDLIRRKRTERARKSKN